jgi:hypothetical protein
LASLVELTRTSQLVSKEGIVSIMLSHHKRKLSFDAQGPPSCQVVCSKSCIIVPTQLFLGGRGPLWHVCGRSIGLGVIKFKSRTHSLNDPMIVLY